MQTRIDEGWCAAQGCQGPYCTVLDISAVTDNNAQRRKRWDSMLATR